MTLLAGERMFVIVPLISKLAFVNVTPAAEDIGTAIKLNAANTRTSPVFMITPP
jgi:hypothetical protein